MPQGIEGFILDSSLGMMVAPPFVRLALNDFLSNQASARRWFEAVEKVDKYGNFF
jgi:hypothetical protein